MEPSSFFAYARQVCSRAFHGAWHGVHTVHILIVLAAGAAALFASELHGYEWIPFVAFLLFFVGRCVQVSFDMYHEQEQRRIALESPPASMSFFLEKNRHFRTGPNGFNMWKVGIRNNAQGSPALFDVRVRIIAVEPLGNEDRTVPNEILDMYIEPTHHQGSESLERINIDAPFDLFTSWWPQENHIRTSHATKHPITGDVNRDFGNLPRGDYRIRLRAEAQNAKPCEADFELRWKDDTLLLEMVAPQQTE